MHQDMAIGETQIHSGEAPVKIMRHRDCRPLITGGALNHGGVTVVMMGKVSIAEIAYEWNTRDAYVADFIGPSVDSGVGLAVDTWRCHHRSLGRYPLEVSTALALNPIIVNQLVFTRVQHCSEGIVQGPRW